MDFSDPDGSLTQAILTLFAFTAASAFFALSQAAVVTLNDSKLKRMAEEGNKKAKTLLKLTDSPTRFLDTVQTGTLLSGLAAASLVTRRFAFYLFVFLESLSVPAGTALPAAAAAAVLIVAFVIVVFGNLLPTRLAGYFPDKIAYALAGPLKLAGTLLSPIVWLFSGAVNFLLRLMRLDPDRVPENVTEEEIRMLVSVGEEKGAIEQSERDMINNIFEFDNRTAEQVMTHRVNVHAVENTASLEEILEIVKQSGHSRVPVYEEDVDNIVGILYAKDLLDLITPSEGFDMQKYMRTPFFVPFSARCVELFKLFKDKKMHMAVVVDEYGGTYGIVTMEDLIESIVGNIEDEYDNEELVVKHISENVYLFDGAAEMEEVEKLLGTVISEEEKHDTIGGFVLESLGNIPKEGEKPELRFGNVIITVVEASENRVKQVRVELLNPPAQDDRE